MRTVIVGPGFQEPFETGSMLMATLAFPGIDEEELRVAAYEALCANALAPMNLTPPLNVEAYRAHFPEFFALDQRETRKRLRTLKRRLRDRTTAAKMSLAFFEEARTGRAAALPEGMTRLSLNQLSRLLLDESRESVAENVEKRAWRETLPVITLALAYTLAARHFEAIGRPFNADLQDEEAHELIVAIAQMHEPLAIADKRINVSEDTLIRLKWLG